MVTARTSRRPGGANTSGGRTRINVDDDGNNNASVINTAMLHRIDEDYDDGQRGVSVSIPVLVTPTNGDQDDGSFVDTSTFDDQTCDDTNSDADIVNVNNDRRTKKDLKQELQETTEDARQTADALHNLWESVRMLQLFLQTPSSSSSSGSTTRPTTRPTKDQLQEEVEINIRGSSSSPPHSQQELLDNISALSNRLPGLLGDDMLGLTHSVCTQHDHIQLHTKEACLLTDDLDTARVAAIHAHERADRAESVSRRLYDEKQYLMGKVKRLSTERRILKDEVRTLRRQIESTRLYDAVTVHEHLLKTSSTPTNQQRQGDNGNAFADDDGDGDGDSEDRQDITITKSLELSSTSDQSDDVPSVRDISVTTTNTVEEEATSTDVAQPIRFLPTPKNGEDGENNDDGMNNNDPSTTDTNSSTKRRGFGLGFRRRFRASKSTTTPSSPSLPPQSKKQQQFDISEDSEDHEEIEEEELIAGETGGKDTSTNEESE